MAARSPDVPADAPILDRRRCAHGVRDRSRFPDGSGCALISREVYHAEILDAKREGETTGAAARARGARRPRDADPPSMSTPSSIRWP